LASTVGKDALLEVLRDACESAGAQYDDYYKSFIGLEGKAQVAGTVGYVVMGAVAAFVNASHPTGFLPTDTPCVREMVTFGPAALALITVILSLSVLWVRSTVIPYAALEQIEEVEDLAKLPDDSVSAERIANYYRGRLQHLRDALNDIQKAVETKGSRLLVTQISLLVTLSSLLVLFYKVIHSVV
jgi:hypothetical protein